MFRQAFWMAYFRAPCMKRTVLWSTGSALAAFKPFSTMHRQTFRFDKEKPTAIKYKNKKGKVAYKGSKFLKSTQFLKVWSVMNKVSCFCWHLGRLHNPKQIYVDFGWFMLVQMDCNQLRVYTPKFASYVVRMLAHFNDPARKQKLPTVSCMQTWFGNTQ